MVNRLKHLLEEATITSIIKDHINSSKMAGFGPLGYSVELFVLNADLEKAQPIVDSFNEEINL